MKLSAFTLIKNAIKLDYPIVESINSLLPFVDEYVINLGISEDGTDKLIYDNFKDNKKVIILEREWEDKKFGTTFFSAQTNAALDMCTGDWCVYLQADECFHEDDGPRIRKWIDRAEREGSIAITCKYHHFIKDARHVRKTYSDGFDVYEKEVRIIKNNGNLISFGDAQSFCHMSNFDQPVMHMPEYVLDSEIYIYHYGWLKDSRKLLDKKKYLKEFYDISHPDRNEKIPEQDGKYILDDNTIKEFKGSHPKVMLERLKGADNV